MGMEDHVMEIKSLSLNKSSYHTIIRKDMGDRKMQKQSGEITDEFWEVVKDLIPKNKES